MIAFIENFSVRVENNPLGKAKLPRECQNPKFSLPTREIPSYSVEGTDCPGPC